MELFNKWKKYFWVELILWYALCMASPLIDRFFNNYVSNFTADVHIFAHDFNKDGTLVWLIHDFCFTWGMFMFSRAVFWFSKSILYKRIFQVIMIDWTWEVFDLFIFNNKLNLSTLVFEGLILTVATIHAYKSYDS